MEKNGSVIQEKHLVPSENHHNSNGVQKLGTDYNFRRKIVWQNVVGFTILHLLALYGLYLILAFRVKFLTIFWTLFLDLATGAGITMGAHRLYSHKSYKATITLRLILIILQTMAGQNCMYVWVRDHRLHHKFSDTDADPHNANRGFFFSHMGWLMGKKHPLVMEKGKTIDMSDLREDSIVMFQKKYYKTLYFTLAVAIPVLLPKYAWNESVWNSAFTSFALRYVLVLHQTWFVNSAAHLWGTKPFDKYIIPSENGFVAFVAGGEGWHNYHHTFPWDYRTSEFGSRFNSTKNLIDFSKYLGLAYDLKAAPIEMVKQRSIRTGDGSHPVYGAKKVETYRWGEKIEEEIIETIPNGKCSDITNAPC